MEGKRKRKIREKNEIHSDFEIFFALAMSSGVINAWNAIWRALPTWKARITTWIWYNGTNRRHLFFITLSFLLHLRCALRELVISNGLISSRSSLCWNERKTVRQRWINRHGIAPSRANLFASNNYSGVPTRRKRGRLELANSTNLSADKDCGAIMLERNNWLFVFSTAANR